MSDDFLTRRFAIELEKAIEAACFGGPPPKPSPTALRMRAGQFESVEIDADGKITEPVRCTCRGMIVMHMSPCPFAGGLVA